MGKLDGKVVIITGAASGMGKSHAKLFAKEGAKVVGSDINFDGLKKVVEEIRNDGGEAIAVAHDVSKKEDWDRVVEETISNYKTINVLVNNAGMLGKEGLPKIEEIDVEDWNQIISVNSTSQFLGVKAVFEEMKKNGAGSIINVSSTAANIGGAGSSHYAASKGAVRSMTKQIALEFGQYNIRINSVHPGLVNTPLLNEGNSEEQVNYLKSLVPLNRLAEPEEVSSAILFLASDDSSFVNGSELVVDGGQISTQN